MADNRETASGGEEQNVMETFPLLDLPPELQLRIFEFAVREDVPIIIAGIAKCEGTGPGENDSAQRRARTASTPPAPPALTRTSRSIRADSLQYYYSTNHFKASYCNNPLLGSRPKTLVEWLRQIGPRYRGLIMKLEVFDQVIMAEPALKDSCILGMKINLERLGAEVEQVEHGLYAVTFPRQLARD